HAPTLLLFTLPSPPRSPLFPYTTLFRSLALPIFHPPGFTFAVVWQPEPLQSALPIAMWLLPGHPAIVIVLPGGGPAKGPVFGPWQERHPVTPWCVPVTE